MMNWYIVQAHSNFENRVAEAILENAAGAGLSSMFGEVIVPKESGVEVRRGRKVTTERKLFPGYVFMCMEDDDRAFHIVRNTMRVSGFLGGGKKPTPMRKEEVETMLNQANSDNSGDVPAIIYGIGDEVQVSDGPFASFNGIVEEVDAGNSRLKVSVSIFGRATPVELQFDQIRKV